MAAKTTLFAYARGNDFEKDAAVVETRLDAFVAGRSWISKDVWVVNQRFPPDWDLGVNLVVAPKKTRPKNWTEDVIALAKELGALHRETGHTFVLGIHDGKSDVTKDMFVVESPEPDAEKLRAAFAGVT
jgi:hypothetical protein